ncbi:MAG TPA: DUF5013 domain-containing protein [Puia sp.]|nr:DUF5013 domain-containing protein [Puia sp.]
MKNKFLHIACWLVTIVMAAIGCEKGPDFKVYKYPAQKASGISPSIGFPGQNVTITGANFDTLKGAVKVWFGGIPVTQIVSDNGTEIVVTVPANAVSGKVGLQVWTTTNDSIGVFTVLPAPTLTSVISHGTAAAIAQAGDTVYISGQNFLTDPSAVAVDFNGTPAPDITLLTSTLIEVITPAGYSAGGVNVTFNGNFTLNGTSLSPVIPTGDVSQFFLKNYKQPLYTSDGTLSTSMTAAQQSGRWYTPGDWNVTSNLQNHTNSYLGTAQGGLDYRATTSDNGLIFGVEAGWGAPAITDGHLWQTITLPAGDYTFETDMRENGFSWSTIYFCAAAGTSLPSTVDGTTTLGYAPIAATNHDNGNSDNIHTVATFSFSLSTSTQISYGIVLPNLDASGNFARFQYFKLTRN